MSDAQHRKISELPTMLEPQGGDVLLLTRGSEHFTVPISAILALIPAQETQRAGVGLRPFVLAGLVGSVPSIMLLAAMWFHAF